MIGINEGRTNRPKLRILNYFDIYYLFWWCDVLICFTTFRDWYILLFKACYTMIALVADKQIYISFYSCLILPESLSAKTVRTGRKVNIYTDYKDNSTKLPDISVLQGTLVVCLFLVEINIEQLFSCLTMGDCLKQSFVMLKWNLSCKRLISESYKTFKNGSFHTHFWLHILIQTIKTIFSRYDLFSVLFINQVNMFFNIWQNFKSNWH